MKNFSICKLRAGSVWLGMSYFFCTKSINILLSRKLAFTQSQNVPKQATVPSSVGAPQSTGIFLLVCVTWEKKGALKKRRMIVSAKNLVHKDNKVLTASPFWVCNAVEVVLS